MPQHRGFYVPLEPRVHPELNAITTAVVDWLRGSGLAEASAGERFERVTRTAELTAWCFPTGRFPDLIWDTVAMAWTFGVEEQFDRTDALSRAEAQQLVGEIDDILTGNGDPRSVWGRAFAELWSHLCAGMSPQWVHRVAGHYRDLMNGYLVETDDRELGTPAPFDKVFQARTKSLGGYVALGSIERSHGEVPAAPRDLPALATFEGAVVRACVLVNDILSCAREARLEGQHNTVLSWAADNSCSIDQAEKVIRGMCDKQTHTMEHTGAAVLAHPTVTALPSPDQQRVGNYVEAAYLLMSGYIEWHYRTARYTSREEPFTHRAF